jgi:hypothetical protein
MGVRGQSMLAAETLEFGLATLFNNRVYATAGFALALATRSMAGGMALARGFAFVISSALSAIPSIGAYARSRPRCSTSWRASPMASCSAGPHRRG